MTKGSGANKAMAISRHPRSSIDEVISIAGDQELGVQTGISPALVEATSEVVAILTSEFSAQDREQRPGAKRARIPLQRIHTQ